MKNGGLAGSLEECMHGLEAQHPPLRKPSPKYPLELRRVSSVTTLGAGKEHSFNRASRDGRISSDVLMLMKKWRQEVEKWSQVAECAVAVAAQPPRNARRCRQEGIGNVRGTRVVFPEER
jgi:hypothetical protein